MRPFRNQVTHRPSITIVLTATVATLSCGNPSSDSMGTKAAAPAPARQATFYPLAVGNSWTFRCSAEGEFQFEKTVRITEDTSNNGTRFFRAEMTRPSDARPLVYYLSESSDTTVSKTFAPSLDKAEPLVRSNVSRGDRVGPLTVARLDNAVSSAIGETDVLSLESYSAEDPTLSQEKRLAWQGRSYGRGVGPMTEADGAGNECVLTKYHLQPK